MEQLRLGLRVYDVRDRRVGDVERIRNCCFEVKTDSSTAAIVPEGIFNIRDLDVTLICDASRVPNYHCPIHSGNGATTLREPVGAVATSFPFK